MEGQYFVTAARFQLRVRYWSSPHMKVSKKGNNYIGPTVVKAKVIHNFCEWQVVLLF